MTDYVEAFEKGTGPYAAEAMRLAGDLYAETYQVGKVIYWRSNDHVPPADVVDFAIYLGFMYVDKDACNEARMAQTDAFFAAYKASRKGTTSEEKAEIEAAFGPGVTVVDVISGKKYRTGKRRYYG